jgi:hypothetical protein
MSIWLKQSTASNVKVGPFVDETDGVTPENGLSISQADIRLSKNGAPFGQTNNIAGATIDENGYYVVPLDTTDTNTLGNLRIAITEAGALLVWQDFMVVNANTWDAFFGAGTLNVTGVPVFPAGAIEFTYTLTDSVTLGPIEGAEVWISTDLAGTNVIWKGDTDAFGIAMDVNGSLPWLDAGVYYFWRQKVGYSFTNPDTETVS